MPEALSDPLAACICISTSALRDNARALRLHLPSGVQIAAVLKANAYGHGRDEVAAVLAQEVDWLAAAEPLDALALARLDHARVLCLGPARGELLGRLVAAGVSCSVDDPAAVASLPAGAVIHLLVDTGLSRLGARPSQVVALREQARARRARIEGLQCMTAGSERGEWDVVEHELTLMRSLAVAGELVHIGGTTVAIERPELVGDIARAGLAILGYPSEPSQRRLIELRPSLKLIAPVLETRWVQTGARVGYDRVPVRRRTLVATLPVGVSHGLNPAADERLGVLLRGRYCPFITRPTLEYALIDATDIGEVMIGEPATVLGGRPDEPTSIETVATRLGLIVDHVLAPLSARIARVTVD